MAEVRSPPPCLTPTEGQWAGCGPLTLKATLEPSHHGGWMSGQHPPGLQALLSLAVPRLPCLRGDSAESVPPVSTHVLLSQWVFPAPWGSYSTSHHVFHSIWILGWNYVPAILLMDGPCLWRPLTRTGQGADVQSTYAERWSRGEQISEKGRPSHLMMQNCHLASREFSLKTQRNITEAFSFHRAKSPR